jgi:NADH dehydrogenase
MEQPIVQRKLPLTKRLWMVHRPGYIKWPVRAVYAVVFSTVSLLGGILLWDATTYRTRYLDGVPVNPLALNPRRGGPKNLKIAEFLVADEETDVCRSL